MRLKVLLAKPLALLDYVFSSGISIDLSRHQVKRFLKSKFLDNSWVQKDLQMNISSLLVSFTEDSPLLLLPTLHSVQSALKAGGLDKNIKISRKFEVGLVPSEVKAGIEKTSMRNRQGETCKDREDERSAWDDYSYL
ncbi:hypothetical protein MA16_Dca016324 [Dendrobium catenatum]|uniref:Uncharacterized protein n=1 Tax=Dendrobium catenatum TaxID=906689 RepID=A0A2I0W899_9ASPA|nr:hypothetical protein MA16_Dca016324 [Dendrobium catenatum]